MDIPITGMAVVFGGQDSDGEFFNAETDFGELDRTFPLYFDHGFDGTVGKQRVGKGSLSLTSDGLRFNGELNVPGKFGNMMRRLIKDDVMGFSTGAVGHLVDKQAADSRVYISLWPIGEISITSSPAEQRTFVALKKTLADLKARNDERMREIRRNEILARHLRIKHEARRVLKRRVN